MKKKGLIISTVVMVVVLIASLTTATYAWFSSQAQATLDDLTINTTAATGLQIAMTEKNSQGSYFNVDKLYSGDLSYENNSWSGTEGWGTYLGFGSIEVGTIEHAVTYLDTGKQLQEFDGFAKTSDSSVDNSKTYYTVAEQTVEVGKTEVTDMLVMSSEKLVYTTDKLAKVSTTYYKVTMVPEPETSAISSYYELTTKSTTITDETKGYYQPIGYDNNTNPIGYRKVNANQKGTYYYLTMAVTNIMNVGALGFNVEVVPSGNTQLANPSAGVANPGMAAASRIQITVKKDGTDSSAQTTTIAPFSDWKQTGSKTMITESADYSEAKDGASNSNGRYTCILGKDNVSANSVYYVHMIIWVEGTDNECNNSTTGTAMKFNINFAYSNENSNQIDWKWENTGTDPTEIAFQ